MKAMIYDRYGLPEVLKLAEVEKPIPKDNEALVKVKAVSVNGSDWEGLRGKPLYARIGGLRKPREGILGSDIAGLVETTGSNVQELQPGDEVFGETLRYSGGFAEYVCVPVRGLVRKPAWLTFEEAAAIPQGSVIALQGIRDQGQVKPGQGVLINGAGGSAGMFAVQLAKYYGAEVTGVDNAGKMEFMRSLGADHVIDYAQEDFTHNGMQYDLILDVIAKRGVFAYRRALKPDGAYYAVGGSVVTILQILTLGSMIGRNTGKKIRLLMVRPNQKDLIFIAELCKAGKVIPVIDRLFKLNQVPDALSYLGEGHARGKVVITID